MRILVINHYAGSHDMGMEYRPWYLGREWVSMGHEVCILAASFSHVRHIQPKVKNDLQETMDNGIRYLWIKTPQYQGNGFGRLFNMIIFSFKIRRYARIIAAKFNPDIVIASSTYTWDNYGARKIAMLARGKYIYEVHDLWPLSPRELGNMPSYHPFILSLQKAENFAYRNAGAVISMLPNTLDYMKHHGLPSEKWHYIPNGIDVREWEDAGSGIHFISKEIKQSRVDGFFTVGYAGSIGIANALDNLIEAAVRLKDSHVKIYILGDGPEKPGLIQKADKNRLHNIVFAGNVSKREIPGILGQFDILFIGLQRQPLFRFGISPNKLLDYMMAGKPVIQAIEAGNDMVSDAGCGMSIPAENPEALADAVLTLMNIPESERNGLGKNGKEYVKKNHDYRILAKKMIHIFDDLK